MLERETEHIAGVIGQRTIGNATAITLREILAADVLPAVRTFFRADVEAMLLEEHRSALKGSRFSYAHPDVRGAQAQYHAALVMHYSFSRKEYLSRLHDAVHLLANYLVRPQWTLTGVVFEKEPAIPVEALHRLLQYFEPYRYIRDVLFRYASDRKIAAFTKEEFSTLLWKIDGAFVKRKTGQEICDALLPLYEFFDYPKNSGKNSIPVKALIKFFEDKGLTDVQTRLEGELAQGLTEVPLLSLAGILEDIRQTAGQFTAERNEARPAGETEAELPGTPSPAAGPPAPDAAPRGGADRPGHDIASAIADPERRKFVRKIFNQEEAKYDEAIGQLSRMSGWKEASRYIDEIFIRNDIDPYSAEAERFTEIVFQQYHPPR